MTDPLPFDFTFVVPVEYDEGFLRLLEGAAAVLEDRPGDVANAFLCACLDCYAGETDPHTHRPMVAELQMSLQIATMGARNQLLPRDNRLSYEKRARLIRNQLIHKLRQQAGLEVLDVAELVVRLRQVDREQRPEHWLWADRIMACSVGRLMRVPGIAKMVLDAERDIPAGSPPGSLARGPEG